VFHGELGQDNCSHLVSYFEQRGATPIKQGDNPANWMLRVMDSSDMGDLSEIYMQSDSFKSLQKELEAIENNKVEDSEIKFESQFAAPAMKRMGAIRTRVRTIYWYVL